MRVLDLFSGIRPARGRLAGSASYQAERGTSGKEPRPCQAWCSCSTAKHRCGGAQADAQYQAHDALRTIGRRAGRPGSACKSVLGSRLARAFRRREHSTLPFSLGYACKTWIDYRGRSELNKVQSNASGSHLRASSVETLNRTVGNAPQSARRPSAAATAPSACSPRNTTLPWPCLAQTMIRKNHNALRAWS